MERALIAIYLATVPNLGFAASPDTIQGFKSRLAEIRRVVDRRDYLKADSLMEALKDDAELQNATSYHEMLSKWDDEIIDGKVLQHYQDELDRVKQRGAIKDCTQLKSKLENLVKMDESFQGGQSLVTEIASYIQREEAIARADGLFNSSQLRYREISRRGITLNERPVLDMLLDDIKTALNIYHSCQVTDKIGPVDVLYSQIYKTAYDYDKKQAEIEQADDILDNHLIYYNSVGGRVSEGERDTLCLIGNELDIVIGVYRKYYIRDDRAYEARKLKRDVDNSIRLYDRRLAQRERLFQEQYRKNLRSQEQEQKGHIARSRNQYRFDGMFDSIIAGVVQHQIRKLIHTPRTIRRR